MNKTLERYLRHNFAIGKIDHSIRTNIVDGEIVFYIHPTNADGETLDFQVKENELIKINNKI